MTIVEKQPMKVINNLSAEEALAVLRELAAQDESMAREIARIALDLLRQVVPADIALVIHHALTELMITEVWDRAGNTPGGYVEPYEAADEMIDEIIDPYLKALKKYRSLGLKEEANKLCQGILWGLYRFETESDTPFKEVAADSPAIFAEVVLLMWKKGRPAPTEMATLRHFIAEQLVGWIEI